MSLQAMPANFLRPSFALGDRRGRLAAQQPSFAHPLRDAMRKEYKAWARSGQIKSTALW